MNHTRANRWHSNKIITINNNLQLNAILRLTLLATWSYGPHSCLHDEQDANVLSKTGTCTLPEFLHWAPIPELRCLILNRPVLPIAITVGHSGPRATASLSAVHYRQTFQQFEGTVTPYDTWIQSACPSFAPCEITWLLDRADEPTLATARSLGFSPVFQLLLGNHRSIHKSVTELQLT